jgi:archaeal type IV pilus assembly protein PilA
MLLYHRNIVSSGNFKVNRKILSGKVRKERRAISPIIATLLLILIAIAAGVVVYAYVIGFVGNSTTNSGSAQSTISVTACMSIAAHCNGGNYYIIIQNVGSTTLSSASVVQIYFQDITNPTTSTIACTLAVSVAPGASITLPGTASTGCSTTTGSAPTVSAGDSISIKVVAADGGSATASTKVIS